MSGTVGQVLRWVNATSSLLDPPPFDFQTPLAVTSTTDTIRISGTASNSISKKVAYIINLTTGVSSYYVNLNIGETFDSGNILVGNNSWEMGYMDF